MNNRYIKLSGIIFGMEDANDKKEDDMNILDNNIQKKMVDYITDEIQILNEEDELFRDIKQIRSNKV